MNYARPELGERLAADYVLGLMPTRARRRFERAMASSATLTAAVAGWSERLAPLDAVTRDETPPARVWRAIDRAIGWGIRQPGRPRRFGFFWRGFAVTAFAACAAVAIYVAVNPTPLSNAVAMLGEKVGISGLMDSAKHMPADVGLSTIRLGVSERERPRWIRATLLLTNDAVPITAAAPQPQR